MEKGIDEHRRLGELFREVVALGKERVCHVFCVLDIKANGLD